MIVFAPQGDVHFALITSRCSLERKSLCVSFLSIYDRFFLHSFGAASHRSPTAMGMSQAGVIVLQPCKRVATHMLRTADDAANDALFSNDFAEQNFLQWFLQWHLWSLPATYNALPSLHEVAPVSVVTADAIVFVLLRYFFFDGFLLSCDACVDANACRRNANAIAINVQRR
jgi:hypothetical protein